MYNWGVALSDIARLVKDKEPALALQCLRQASERYAEALDLQPGNPQALNNWGLVLQDLSGHAQSAAERDQLVFYALEKFRHAVRLRPDFDRGCYNLGTVLYTYACAAQAELANQLKAGRLTANDAETTKERSTREARVRSLFTTAAQYICLAYALQQGKEIYRRSLAVVKPMLPLPFLRAGYLTVPCMQTMGGPAESWRREWFVLDHDSLRSATALESSLSNPSASSGLASGLQLRIGHPVNETPLVIPLTQITSSRRCFDPSLPEGEAFWLLLSSPPHCAPGAAAGHHAGGGDGKGGGGGGLFGGRASVAAQGPGHYHGEEDAGSSSGAAAAAAALLQQHAMQVAHGLDSSSCLYFVADDAESADAWVDALLLSFYVSCSRGPGVLAEALTPGGGVQQAYQSGGAAPAAGAPRGSRGV